MMKINFLWFKQYWLKPGIKIPVNDLPGKYWLLLLLIVTCFYCQYAVAVVERPANSVGEIVSASGDAQIQLIQTTDWLTAEVEQDLLAGDHLKTGRLGSMALLFADRTQIRMHRNSLLRVKAIASKSGSRQSLLQLDKGSIWSRATKGNYGLRLKTPSATAAIRGTDWSLSVDEQKRTTLIVLDGEVILENEFGKVSVSRGEIAVAEIGKAPTKTIIVHPNDREQILYNLSLPDSFHLFSLTGLITAQRNQAKNVIEQIPAQQRSLAQWFDYAELAYDMADRNALDLALDNIQKMLKNDPKRLARKQLIEGYLKVFESRYEEANKLLAQAQNQLADQQRLKAIIGRVVSLIIMRQHEEAEKLLAELKQRYSDKADYVLLDVILTAFSGDLDKARSRAQQQAKVFPDVSTFPVLQGMMAILLDKREEANDSAEQAFAIDPDDAAAYLVKGFFLDDFERDGEGAVDAFKAGLEMNPFDASLWGALGLSYLDLGEEKKSEIALKKALSIVPDDIVALGNYAILLLDQYRIHDAQTVINKLQKLAPDRDFVLLRQGRLAMQMDDMQQAEHLLLKGATVNPLLSEASIGLAVSYYEQNNLPLAKQTLANASRLDSRDPIVPLVSSMIALDRYEADQAIIDAREAIKRYRQQGGRGVTGLAASRGGLSSLGTAFHNLGLSAWGDYYSELSFDPYSADSHFFRTNKESVIFSELYQGLILEPLAGAARTRFIDFFRRPFTDSEVSATLGQVEHHGLHGGAVTMQGFQQDWLPMSYYLNLDYTDNHGHRDNGHNESRNVNLFWGVNLTPDERLLIDFNTGKTETGYPGSELRPDPDDMNEVSFWQLGLNYSHIFSARNRLMARVNLRHVNETFKNAIPFGTNLSSLDYSLINNLGLEATQILHETGLQDGSIDPETPLIVIGVPPFNVSNTIPDNLDVNPLAKTDVEQDSIALQIRHMFSVDDLDYSYGFEFQSFKRHSDVDALAFVQRDPGEGLLASDTLFLPFIFGDAKLTSAKVKQKGMAVTAHFDALYRIRKNIWLEGSLFLNHYNNDLDKKLTRIQPRVGAAWAFNESNWLRLIYRKDMNMPFVATLSPVATVGIVPDLQYLEDGGLIDTTLMRWDREWSSQLFTAVSILRQDLKDFTVSVPASLSFFEASKARIDAFHLEANYWLKSGLGLSANMILRDTKNQIDWLDKDYDLPLIADREIKAGITWVHPRFFRASLVANYKDDFTSDYFETTEVEDYVTTDIYMNWEPANKKYQISLNLYNVFDKRYDYASYFPAPGRTIEANFKMRF